jgi:hypothetical protein
VSRAGRGRSFWREVVAELDASGLTAAEFADREGLTLGSLRWWRWNLGRDEVAEVRADRAFVEVVRPSSTPPAEAGHVRVYLAGVVVELSTLPPARWLAELADRC